ncbi:cellulose binding domain-containing protein [Actinoplanes subglobosus]|uniref:Cellulose binding domain-containing protein n=1 Tax=Actinoplanes subglobosus TaxID=1547892 RepID=A0ABV8IXC8_9ACTN
MSRTGRALAVVVALTGAVGPATAARADATACGVTYRASPYTGGFTASITVTNTGDETIRGWTFRFPLEATVAEFWNADLLVPVTVVTTQAKAWNAVVQPGDSFSLGFRAVGTAGADPAWFTVNDLECEIGG